MRRQRPKHWNSNPADADASEAGAGAAQAPAPAAPAPAGRAGMAAGRGTMPGRGHPHHSHRQQQQTVVRRPVKPTRLHLLQPRTLLYRSVSYLDVVDKKRALASVGIQYRPPSEQRAAHQQMMRRKQLAAAQQQKQMAREQGNKEAGAVPDMSQLSMAEDTTGVSGAIEAAAAARTKKDAEEEEEEEDKKEEEEDGEEDSTTEAAGPVPGEQEKNNKEEQDDDEKTTTKEESSASATDDKKNGEKSTEGEDKKDGTTDSAKKAPRPTKPRVAPFHSPPDPDTLLARLNTRRLYKRLKYYKSQNLGRAYTPNKTVEELAEEEWEGLLDRARRRNTAKMAGKDDYEGKNKPLVPSPYELLMFSPCPRAVTILASYPRSGNSLVRTLFERTTLRVTGSDMRGGLTKHDLVGEAAVSAQKVQFVKTHYPERRGTPPFRASRVVLLVRNPFDAIDSFFNLMMTNTHTASVEFTEDQKQKATKAWEDMAVKEMHVWKEFHEFWLSQDVPMLLVRYEDLIRHPDEVTARIVRFVLEIKNMGSFFTERIDRCIREEQLDKLGSYKPRSGGIGKSLKKYSPELLQRMNMGIYEIMTRLGYGEDFLVPNQDLWQKLKPLDHYAAEWEASTQPAKGEEVPSIVINRGRLARGKDQETDWRAVKQSLGLLSNEKCTCYRCVSAGKTST